MFTLHIQVYINIYKIYVLYVYLNNITHIHIKSSFSCSCNTRKLVPIQFVYCYIP